jgi:hypothetical protein
MKQDTRLSIAMNKEKWRTDYDPNRCAGMRPAPRDRAISEGGGIQFSGVGSLSELLTENAIIKIRFREASNPWRGDCRVTVRGTLPFCRGLSIISHSITPGG